MDPTFPLVPVANFLCAILVLLLLPWRFSSWSTAIRVYIVWLAVLCTCRGISSIIWRDNTDDVAPVWCDISESSNLVYAISVLMLYILSNTNSYWRVHCNPCEFIRDGASSVPNSVRPKASYNTTTGK